MIFIDESGDWGFNKGSSRFTTIAGFIPDPKQRDDIKRYIRHSKKKIGLRKKDELHAAHMKLSEKRQFLLGLLEYRFDIIYMTLNKAKVKNHLKKEQHILFNYQAEQLLAPYLKKRRKEHVVFDQRSQRVTSTQSLFDYLKTEVLIVEQATTDLTLEWGYSHQQLGLQAADIIVNAIWQRYERDDHRLFDIFKDRIIIKGTLSF